ncbi:MAG: hypothetical protein V3571_14300 [Pseudodesulfovibrio sp.]
MKLRVIYDIIVVSLANFIAVKGFPFLISEGYSTSWAFVLSVSSGAIIYVFCLLFREACIRSKIGKMIFIPNSRYQGRYIETIAKEDGKRVYSIFDIKYNYQRGMHQILGVSYSSEGEVVANWSASSLEFHPDESMVKFFHSGEVIHKHDERKGYTVQHFDERAMGGNGYYVEKTDANISCYSFIMERVTSKITSNTINKSAINTHDEKIQFVISYHQLFGNKRTISPPVIGKGACGTPGSQI